MANRRLGGGSGSNFDGSFSRRPVTGGGGGNFQNQGQNQQYGSPFGQQTQSRQPSFDQSYSRREKGGSDFYGDGARGNYGQANQSNRGNFNAGGGGGGRDGYGGDDFGSRGNTNSQQFQQSRVVRDREDLQPFNNSGVGNVGWRQRSPSPRGGSSGKMFAGMNRDGNWGRNQSQGFDDNQQGSMRSGGTNPGQQVVMVVPQGNTGTGGLMGMVPVQAQNPFNMAQRQQPMQVIVGNLPAFNADLGQQILAAASARPQFGQGMMGGPQMGLVNQQNMQRQQQQQQFNRYDRSVAEGGSRSNDSGRFSRQSSSQQRSSGRSAVARRSDPPSRSSASGRGIGSNSSAATLRANRKRAVLRDRHGATDEVERKRARTSLPIRGGNRTGPNKSKAGGNQKGTKKKGAADAKKNEAKKAAEGKTEGKKEKDDKDAVKAEGDDDATAKKEADGEDKPETDGDATAEGEEKKKSKYDEFATSLFVCKICQKVMSDGASFESHLNGRAHVALVKILEERFQKRAELLMFESKLSEEEIGIERERQRRAGKSGHTGKGSKNFCKMCDCNYTVNWGTHKVSMGHRLLKEYLHPTCRFCTTNFVHRMDWVNHLYSVSHLRKLTELKEQGMDLEEQESASQEELFAVTVDVGKDERATNLFLIRPSDYSIPLKEDLKEMLKDEKGELALPEGEIEFPKEYDENQKYGEEAIMRTEGACCKVCRVYISNVSDIETHLKSKPHYGMYVSYLKKIVKYRENLKAAEEKAAKEAAELAEKEKKKAEEEAAAAAAKEKEEQEKALKAENDSSSSTADDKSTDKVPKSTDEQGTVEPIEKAESSETPMETEQNESNTEASGEGVGEVVTEDLAKTVGTADVEMADAQVEEHGDVKKEDAIDSASVKTEGTTGETVVVKEEVKDGSKKPDASKPAGASPTTVKPAAASPTKSVPATPAKPAAATPTKPTPQQQNRGNGNQQQARGRGGARGNSRGGSPARGGGGGGGTAGRGRGGPQTPQGRGGGATPSRGGGGGGGGNMRGRTPGRGGANDSGWRGGRGGRGGRGSFQR